MNKETAFVNGGLAMTLAWGATYQLEKSELVTGTLVLAVIAITIFILLGVLYMAINKG